VTTHLARFTHAERYKGDPQDVAGTHAVFTNGMTMWMADDDGRVASWLPGDKVHMCKVFEPSPWMCGDNGECINLLTMRIIVRVQNITRHDPPIDPRLIACAKNRECPPAKAL
jgi:hypothetical protein